MIALRVADAEVGEHDNLIRRNIDEEPPQRALAAALVTFANELGASIVAEGVERPGRLSIAYQR